MPEPRVHPLYIETLMDTIMVHPARPEMLADAWQDARARWDRA